MLIVTGHVHVEPSDLDAFAADLQTLALATRQRDGNLFYVAAIDDPREGRLLVAERWRDPDSLAAHLRAADTMAFVKRWQGRMRSEISKFDAGNGRSLMEE